MDKTVKKNRNYEKTEIAIKDALVKLCYEKKSLSKVTVKELCEKANIAKSTFYLHYPDILSIFESVGDKFLITFQDMFEDLLKNKTTDFLIYFKQIFAFINESGEIIKIGLSFDQPIHYYVNGIKEQLETAVMHSPLFIDASINKKQILVEIKIVTSGIIDFIIEFLKSNELNKLEKYATFINDFLNRWISSLKMTTNNKT